MSAAPAGAGTVRLVTYSGDDPLIIPKTLFDALPRFDGHSMDEALRTLSEEDGLEVDPAVVRRLLDFDVLAAPPGATAP